MFRRKVQQCVSGTNDAQATSPFSNRSLKQTHEAVRNDNVFKQQCPSTVFRQQCRSSVENYSTEEGALLLENVNVTTSFVRLLAFE